MADINELETNLCNYRLQLQQVDAALLSDVGNTQLSKLHDDLQEVLDLTVSLIANHSSKKVLSNGNFIKSATNNSLDYVWKVGDKCMALYETTKMVYDAQVTEILPNKKCKVKFDNFGNTEILDISMLKRRLKATSSESDPIVKKAKRDIVTAERDLKKKKALKKAQRMKVIDDEREDEKNKWKSFNSKVFSKTSKGKVKKSIFATPEDGCVEGHVGVGTCGTAGKPMTSFEKRPRK